MDIRHYMHCGGAGCGRGRGAGSEDINMSKTSPAAAMSTQRIRCVKMPCLPAAHAGLRALSRCAPTRSCASFVELTEAGRTPPGHPPRRMPEISSSSRSARSLLQVCVRKSELHGITCLTHSRVPGRASTIPTHHPAPQAPAERAAHRHSTHLCTGLVGAHCLTATVPLLVDRIRAVCTARSSSWRLRLSAYRELLHAVRIFARFGRAWPSSTTESRCSMCPRVPGRSHGQHDMPICAPCTYM